MIPLDDPLWDELKSNYGKGRRAADLLKRAAAGEPFDSWYDDLFQEFCHQYTLSEVAYAGMPHLVALAEQAGEHRIELLVLIGACVAAAGSPEAPAIPAGFEPGWQRAIETALPLVGQALGEEGLSAAELRYLIVSAAALHGETALAEYIEAFDE